MPVTELLEKNAHEYGNETALVEIDPKVMEHTKMTWKEYSLIETNPALCGRSEITWKEFDDKANKFANLLLSRGVQKGDKVSILLMNCLEWLPIYFGILKAGAVAVPLNYRYTAEEIRYCVELSDSVVLIFGPEFIGRVEEVCDKMPRVKQMFFVGANYPTFAESYDYLVQFTSASSPNIQITDEDDAAIYFSSGTTGFPKAILHAHKSLMHASAVEQIHHNTTHDDVFLCIPPLYHTGAKMHWMGSLRVGSKAVLLRGVKPEWILQAISEEKCTIVWLLVPWAQDILDGIERGDINLDDYELSQWRLMHIGAQPVPPSLIKRWKKYFPNHQYDTNYGLSESIGPGCVHLGVDNIHKVGAIGVAGYGWETKIIDANGNPVKQGEVGELAVKGPGVMRCYYNDEKSTNEVLKDGWLLTGDMAQEDEDGFIYLVDRAKDVIITGGENIYPVQIEDYLRTNDNISDVAVIGLPDPRLGEIAAAIIKLKEGHVCTEEEIMDFCRELPRYKRPKKIIFADVPRNPTGKIEKPKLRKKYCGESVVKKQIEI